MSVRWVGDTGDERFVSRDGIQRGIAAVTPLLTGDVCLALPPLPELVVALGACREAGISPTLVHPLDDLRAAATASAVITASAFLYRGDVVFLKERIDDVAARAERIVVVDRLGWMPLGATMDVYHEVPMHPGRDVWFPALPSGGVATDDAAVAPSLREVVADPSRLMGDRTLVLYESLLEPDDADYVGASGTSLGSRGAGRLS